MKRRMTVFGATIFELMAKRGVRTWTELSMMMATRGYGFSPDSIRNWSYARSNAHKTFPGAVVEVLGLDDAERTRLALAFAYDQDRRFGEGA